MLRNTFFATIILILQSCTANEGVTGTNSDVDSSNVSPDTTTTVVDTTRMVKASGDTASTISATATVYDALAGSADHSTFKKAVDLAGLQDVLKQAGPFTVFAPSNAAFSKLDKTTYSRLMAPTNKTGLTAFVQYHIVKGNYTTDMLKDKQRLTTVEGENIMITRVGNKFQVNGDRSGNDANILMVDLTSRNGVVHAIDAVLMPKDALVMPKEQMKKK